MSKFKILNLIQIVVTTIFLNTLVFSTTVQWKVNIGSSIMHCPAIDGDYIYVIDGEKVYTN